MKKRWMVFWFLVLGAAALLGATALLIFTQAGGRFVARRVMTGLSSPDGYDVKAMQGSLASQLTLREVELRDGTFLPDGTVLRVQKVDIYFDSLSPGGLNVEVVNGRFLLPGSAVLVADGMYQEGAVDAQVYVRNAEIQDLLGLFPADKDLASLRGPVVSFDATVTGPLSALKMEGGLETGKVYFERIAGEDVRLRFSLTVFSSSRQPLEGTLVIESGRLVLPRSTVRLTQGRVTLRRDDQDPSLDLKGEAVVGRTPIRIHLTGTPAAPELRFASDDASLSQMHLMAMLLTGRSLSSDQEAVARGQIPADLAKDVLDLLVFGGRITEFISRLGLTDVTFRVEPNAQGIGATKEITKDLQVRYGVEQAQGRNGEERTTTQSAGVSYDVGRGVSVEATTAASRSSAAGVNETASPQTDNSVLLKYKTTF